MKILFCLQLVYKVREETNKVKVEVAKDNARMKGAICSVLEALKPCFDAAGPYNTRNFPLSLI